MGWCEAHGVEYVVGLAKNSRLKAAIAEEMVEAKVQYEATGQAARVFKDFRYRTRTSWSWSYCQMWCLASLVKRRPDRRLSPRCHL